MKQTKLKISIMLFTCYLFLASCHLGSNNTSSAQETNSKDKGVTEQTIVDAYVYLLGRAFVVRQEQIDLKEPGIAYNTIKYNEAGKADFANPNLDVAYMEAWYAIDENSAVIIEIPKIVKRYYTVQLMDGWGEVLYNLNERLFTDHPYGKFALCLENTKAQIPTDAKKIIVPVKKIKMLARVELQNTKEEAIKLQKQFKATVIGKPVIEKIPELPSFPNAELPDLSVFEFANELLLTPDSKMSKVDSIQEMCKKAATYVLSSEENKAAAKKLIREKAIPEFIKFAKTKAGKLENNWLGVLIGGEYHGDYWTRTAANFLGIWANSVTEVIYFITEMDKNGDKLNGNQDYVIHFEKSKLPASNVNGYWSVILVDVPNYRVVENELKRYNFNNYAGLKYETDGSLKIYMSPKYNAKWPKENWLPSPTNGGKFSLTMRMYVPKENVIKGEWFPAAIEKIK
jgi:hypothetical protein